MILIIEDKCAKLSQHDKNFLHFLSWFDFQIRVKDVEKYIKNILKGAPLSTLFAYMDYTGMGVNGNLVELNVLPIATYRWTDEAEKLEWDDMYRRMATLDKPHMMTRVLVRGGEGNRTFPMMFSMEEVLTKMIAVK